jgi:hypothetical protein
MQIAEVDCGDWIPVEDIATKPCTAMKCTKAECCEPVLFSTMGMAD